MVALLERPAIALRGVSTVAGRYVIGDEPMHPGANLFACRLRDISADAFTITAPVIPQPGEAVTATFGPFGRLAGHVERNSDDGFTVGIAHRQGTRNGLEQALTAFRDRTWSGTRERRADHRFMPGNPRSTISRPDAWIQPCLIVDYSASGAAVSSAFQPEVGEVVSIGQITSEVVRIFDVGFAVRFFEKQDLEDIESLLEAPDEWARSTHRHAAMPRDPLAAYAYGGDG